MILRLLLFAAARSRNPTQQIVTCKLRRRGSTSWQRRRRQVRARLEARTPYCCQVRFTCVAALLYLVMLCFVCRLFAHVTGSCEVRCFLSHQLLNRCLHLRAIVLFRPLPAVAEVARGGVQRGKLESLCRELQKQNKTIVVRCFMRPLNALFHEWPICHFCLSVGTHDGSTVWLHVILLVIVALSCRLMVGRLIHLGTPPCDVNISSHCSSTQYPPMRVCGLVSGGDSPDSAGPAGEERADVHQVPQLH